MTPRELARDIANHFFVLSHPDPTVSQAYLEGLIKEAIEQYALSVVQALEQDDPPRGASPERIEHPDPYYYGPSKADEKTL